MNDEIDLRKLFLTLWRGKIYIILLSLLFVYLSSMYLHSAVRKYTIEYNLKPVAETKNSSSLSGLSGFASIAGIELPSSSNNDFNIFKELIFSAEVSEIIFENTKFLIGQNSQENWNLLDSCNKINNEYIWFHLNSFPSCYVIMCSPLNDISCIESKNILLNYGAELCKQNTTKLNDLFFNTNIVLLFLDMLHLVQCDLIYQ